MTILTMLKQVFVPVNQPTNFPRLYFIPETTTLPSQHPASNDPRHQQSQPTHITSPREPGFRKHVRLKKEIFQESCANAWAALKAFGRATVRWVARWLVQPLSIACICWIPFAGPAELPL